MLNLNFLEKALKIVFPLYFVYNFPRKMFSAYTLFAEQISFPDFIYLLRYWLICVLHMFVNQVVTLKILKLTLPF